MLGMVPVFILFSISVHENYIQFMTETLLGQIATVCVTIVFLVCLWVITKKISAPLEEVKDERI